MMAPTMASPETGGLGGRELLRLIVGQSCVHASMAGMRMAAPLMALREGFSEAAVGFLLALFALSSVFLALPAGRYADRHGLKRPMSLCVAASALGAGLAVAWPVFPVLCLAASLTGAAAGAAVLALQRHVGRASNGAEELRKAFSWLAIGPAFSNFVGPLAAGLLIDHGGFRAAFLALAVAPVAGWMILRTAREAPIPPGAGGARSGKAWNLLLDPPFRRLLLLNWLLSSSWDVHTFIVPVLGHERGLSASVIGALLASFAFAATAVRVALPLVASRVREWLVILVAMTLAAVAFLVYPLVQAPLAMGLCSVMLGLTLGAVHPMIMSMLHQITPEHRHGEALGLRLMSINVSSVLMPVLFGAMGAVVGVAGVFWVMAGVLGGGTPLAHGMRRVGHAAEAGDQGRA